MVVVKRQRVYRENTVGMSCLKLIKKILTEGALWNLVFCYIQCLHVFIKISFFSPRTTDHVSNCIYGDVLLFQLRITYTAMCSCSSYGLHTRRCVLVPVTDYMHGDVLLFQLRITYTAMCSCSSYGLHTRRCALVPVTDYMHGDVLLFQLRITCTAMCSCSSYGLCPKRKFGQVLGLSLSYQMGKIK